MRLPILNFITSQSASLTDSDIASLVDRGIEIADDFDTKATAIRDDIRLTPEAKRDDLRAAAADAVPTFVKFRDAVADIESRLAARRTALVPNDFDAAGAAIRAECRAAMRGLTPGDHVALVTDPTTDVRILESIVEAPALLTGVSAETRDLALTTLIERRNPGQQAEITDLAEQIVWARNVRDVIGDLVKEASGEVAKVGFDAFVEANS